MRSILLRTTGAVLMLGALSACGNSAETTAPAFKSAVPDSALRATSTVKSELRCPGGECPYLMPGSNPPAYQCGPCNPKGN